MAGNNVDNFFKQTGNRDNEFVSHGTVNGGKLVSMSRVTATVAEINAGKVLVPAVSGKTIVVTDFAARVNGTFTTATSVDVEDTSATVSVQSLAIAQVVDAAVLQDADTGVTRGAGMFGSITLGEALQVIKKGSDAAGGTDIEFFITYSIQ